MPLPFRQDAVGLKQARVAFEREYNRAASNTIRAPETNQEFLEKLDWLLGVVRREEREALKRSGAAVAGAVTNGTAPKKTRRPARTAA